MGKKKDSSIETQTLFNDEGFTSDKLFNHLFGACDILRGPITHDEYKNYITPLLFFKRLSDVYDEETAAALEESGGDEAYAAFPDNHSVQIPDGCHWKDVRERSQSVGEAIRDAMIKIENENQQLMKGVFTNFQLDDWAKKDKFSDERLKNLVEHMSRIRLGNGDYSADVMGDAYEFLIKKFADLSKKNAGEFYTPRTIVRLMVRLIAPAAGETVYDPACGTGGMLIEAVRYIGNREMTYGRIFGQEKNLETSAIARMNLSLHGAKDFSVIQGDTLRDPKFVEHGTLKKFSCVIANPPFSLKKWGASEFSTDQWGRNIWGSPTDSNADFAWLQHMVYSMDEQNGRCAVIMPQGVLFRGGKDGEIRRKLIESGKLDCVITLASGIFYSTGVSACILFLNNNKPEAHKGRVCLIDASAIYTPQRAQNIMTVDDVSRVCALYEGYEDVAERVRIVTLDEISEKGCSLSPSAYLAKEAIETAPPEEVLEQYRAALAEVREAEEKLARLLARYSV